MNYQQYNDHELVALMKAGEDEAFTAIYNRYWKKLLVVAANKTGGDIAEAEEIVQDLFVALWNRRDRLELTSSLDNYLAVAVKYRVIKTLARRDHQRRYAAHRQHTQGILDNATQEWLEFEELRRRLEVMVAALPEKCRLVYHLSREQGYSQKRIAEEVGISEKTVEAHLGKALKTLRNGLDILLVAVWLQFLLR